jgi:hypothetical protein
LRETAPRGVSSAGAAVPDTTQGKGIIPLTEIKNQNFKNLLSALKGAPPLALEGRVTKVSGLVIEGD